MTLEELAQSPEYQRIYQNTERAFKKVNIEDIKSRKVVIWGTQICAIAVTEYLLERGVEPYCFADDNVWGGCS